MRTKSTVAAVACATALITAIALVSSCSPYQNLNKTQTKPEQSLNRIQTEIEKALLTSENAEAKLDAEDVDEDANSLTVGSSDGFALWVRGRLALSSGGESDELLFEVDPATGRTRAWTSVAVDGAVSVAGNLAARGIDVSGTMRAHAVEAADMIAQVLQSDGIESREVLADAVEAGSIEGNALAAASATVDALAARGAEMTELAAEQLTAEDIRADTLAVGSARADVLEAISAIISEVSATSVQARSLTGENLEAADVRAGHVDGTSFEAGSLYANALSGNSLEVGSARMNELVSAIAQVEELACNLVECVSISVDELQTGSLDARAARVGSLEAEAVSASELSAGSVDADAIEAQELAAETVAATRLAGTLDAVCPGEGFAGVVVFPASGPGADPVDACVVETDSRVDGMVVTPAAQGGVSCIWEVEQVDAGRWEIRRRILMSGEEASDGTLGETVGETVVYWLAFDLG